jgi:hypothetical protein
VMRPTFSESAALIFRSIVHRLTWIMSNITNPVWQVWDGVKETWSDTQVLTRVQTRKTFIDTS